jgi:hypothetical protein
MRAPATFIARLHVPKRRKRCRHNPLNPSTRPKPPTLESPNPFDFGKPPPSLSRVRNGELYRMISDSRGAFVQVGGGGAWLEVEGGSERRVCARISEVGGLCGRRTAEATMHRDLAGRPTPRPPCPSKPHLPPSRAVQPALYEAFGLTVVEAMTCGWVSGLCGRLLLPAARPQPRSPLPTPRSPLPTHQPPNPRPQNRPLRLPTFATAHGGPSEIIVHGRSGYHIDPYHGDAVSGGPRA